MNIDSVAEFFECEHKSFSNGRTVMCRKVVANSSSDEKAPKFKYIPFVLIVPRDTPEIVLLMVNEKLSKRTITEMCDKVREFVSNYGVTVGAERLSLIDMADNCYPEDFGELGSVKTREVDGVLYRTYSFEINDPEDEPTLTLKLMKL